MRARLDVDPFHPPCSDLAGHGLGVLLPAVVRDLRTACMPSTYDATDVAGNDEAEKSVVVQGRPDEPDLVGVDQRRPRRTAGTRRRR